MNGVLGTLRGVLGTLNFQFRGSHNTCSVEVLCRLNLDYFEDFGKG